jgi:hypothetical protein
VIVDLVAELNASIDSLPEQMLEYTILPNNPSPGQSSLLAKYKLMEGSNPKVDYNGKILVYQIDFKAIIKYNLKNIKTIIPNEYVASVKSAYEALINYIRTGTAKGITPIFTELDKIFSTTNGIGDSLLLKKLRGTIADPSENAIRQRHATILDKAIPVSTHDMITDVFRFTNRQKLAFILSEAINNYIIMRLLYDEKITAENYPKYIGKLTVSKLGDLLIYAGGEVEMYIFRGIDTALMEYCTELKDEECSKQPIETLPNDKKLIKNFNIDAFTQNKNHRDTLSKSLSGGSRQTKKKQRKVSSKKRQLKTYNKARVSARHKSAKSGLGKSKKRARSA